MGDAREQAADDRNGQPTVFLSYARDDQARAQQLVKVLEDRGFRVWWDGLISGGHTFADKIEKALESADAIVVLWSAHSIHSHWVRDEASFGRDHDRMVPVSLDGSEAPLGFRQLHHIDFSHWKGSSTAPEFDALCQSIRSVAGSSPGLTDFAIGTHHFTISRRQAIVGGGALATLAAGGAGLYWLKGGNPAQANRIAVLPFRNLGGDKGQDYFSDGLAEELRATLSRSDQLSVAAQTSSDRFRDADADAQTAAKALGVSYLIEGSVRQANGTIRVATRIIDGKTGFDQWSKNFDSKATDSLAIQSDIAAFVTDAILAGIDKDTRPAERIGGTKKSDAFDAYLRGAALYRLAEGEKTDRAALGLFDRAVLLDPNYAAAHAARSRVLTFIGNNYVTGADLARTYDQAIAAARRSIEIAPDLAEGYSALGFVLFNGQLDANGAAQPYQLSYELGFGNADILSAYASYAGRTGKFDDGREAIQRAEQLDPLNASVFRNAGYLEYAARDYPAAEKQLRSALSINPKATNVRSALGDIAYMRGDPGVARTLFLEEPDENSKWRGLAIVDFKLGDQAQAQSDLVNLATSGGDTVHYQQAQVYAQWGDKAEALNHLETAYAKRDAGLVRLRNDPLLDPVRQDARFAEIERRIGFA